MQDLDLAGATLRYAGVQDVEHRADGSVGLSRLPAWTKAQIVDPTLQLLVGMTSGARLELVTDSRTIELEVGLTLLRMGDAATIPAAFDLVVDGALVDGCTSIDGTVIVVAPDRSVDFLPGPATATVRFEGLPAGEKHVEVWLPHAAAMVLHAVRLDDGATAVAPPADTRVRWVHYGSSISHCLEAERPTGVWPVVAARAADVALASVAFGGQAQLDQFAARTISALPADVISLKVGINLVNADSMRERTFVPAVHGFLDTIRDGHPTTPILLITPILCPAHEDAPGPTISTPTRITSFPRPAELGLGALTIGRIRALLADVVAARIAAGDAHLRLLDGRDLFGEDDLADLPDGLHPNAAGYVRMGERFTAWARHQDLWTLTPAERA